MEKANYLFFDDLRFWGLALLIIFVLLHLELILHELGHWIAAKCCGYRILGMSFGDAFLLWGRKFESSLLEWRLIPTEGYVSALKESGPEKRWQRLLLSAGGPFMTFLCLIIFIALAWFPVFETTLNETWALFFKQIAQVMTVLTAISLIYNLWPHYGQVGGQAVVNDGLSILRALIAKDYPREEAYQSNLRDVRKEVGGVESDEAVPESPSARERYYRFQFHLLTGDIENGLVSIEEATTLPHLHPIERVYFNTARADLALACRNRPLVRRSLESLEKELETFPRSEPLLAKSGALMIELQFYDDGRRRLIELQEESEDRAIQAYCQCYIALSLYRQKQVEKARQMIKEARFLDYGNLTYHRIYAEIFGGSGLLP